MPDALERAQAYTENKPSKFLGLFNIKPRPHAFARDKTIPERRANPISRIFFSWITPVLLVGYSRPLELDDIWHLTPEYEAERLASDLETKFYERVPPWQRPVHLRKRKIAAAASTSRPSADQKTLEGHDEEDDAESKDPAAAPAAAATLPHLETGGERPADDDGEGKVNIDGRTYDRSLLLALNRVVFWRFWGAAPIGLIGAGLLAASPLVSRALLEYIQESYAYTHPSPDAPPPNPPRSIGYGIGLAFVIWAMQQISSLLINHYINRSLITGFLMRAALIGNISRKSLRLSGEARIKHPNGQLVTHISADTSFMDWIAMLAHDLWLQPAQIIIGIGILGSVIGYSAVVGLAVLIAGIPLQSYFFKRLIATRHEQMGIVDDRVRLLNEILNGIRVIKLMAYESYFEERVMGFRKEEIERLRVNCFFRACATALMQGIPVFAAILSFVTYSLSGHDLDPAIIFTALQAFNNIRAPLLVLPLALQSLSDAHVGLKRIGKVMLASEIDNPVPVNQEAKFAVSAHADYSWDGASTAPAQTGIEAMGRASKKHKRKVEAAAAKAKEEAAEKGEELAADAVPFSLRDINVDIERGSFVVVCGRVGSGKSSLVQALLGEMKLTRGDAYLGGSVSYFPQIPWIQNATLRDNILFGSVEPDEKRLREAITSCALDSDVAMLTHGLQTEIGERGINLSGGQKARACLARCVYADADICFLDDPLSAVDAHVSAKLVDCFTNGPLKSKTRILVTHHLEVLPKADLIITMLDGRIAEMGTYDELLAADGAMAKLLAEHVSARGTLKGEGLIENPEDVELEKLHIQDETVAHVEDEQVDPETEEKPTGGGDLTSTEERETGAINSAVYAKYIESMRSVWKAPSFLLFMLLAQAANVGTTIFLGYWSENSINGWNQGQYMGLYAGLGIAYVVLTFLGSLLLFVSGIDASYNLFNEAYGGVANTSVAWLDSTPIGRIVSRLSKDFITLDDQLPMQWNQLLSQALNVLGVVALVFYSFPWLGIMLVPLFFLYYVAAAFYRSSSREVKRIDSNMRSFIYAAFGEMLNGLATVRAYHAEVRFIEKIERLIDLEDRCYLVTIVLQRWLGVRLDALGALLVLAISLFGVGFRNNTSPSKLGVVLTYSLTLTQIFSTLVNTFAQVEQDMNCVERTVNYAQLPPEAPKCTRPNLDPKWPSRGTVHFDEVVLKYREDLPPVLKGTSFMIPAGEKVGIVGRTGAGKSSLLQALYRTVELTSGKISIDDEDCRNIDLHTLRSRLGIVPQDPFLWSGTVRANLDPEGLRTDAELNDALHRCHLAERPEHKADVRSRLKKFKLDALVQDEGANFSAGERQLLALARVVVRDSRIIVLDEATSSVDVETDADIQDTIRTQLQDKTLLCIAHRLATIAFYDRVLVMDAGEVIEIDTPLALFDKADSIFRGMCDKAALSREDILRIRGETA